MITQKIKITNFRFFGRQSPRYKFEKRLCTITMDNKINAFETISTKCRNDSKKVWESQT